MVRPGNYFRINMNVLETNNTRYWVNLDGISLSQEDGTVDAVFSGSKSQPVLLDSGYTVSALPGPIFNKILAAFPTAKANGGAYVDVDCSVADVKGTVDFKFGNKVIKVPYADFIWHNEDRCVLGVFQDDEFPVLGDTFLRAAYVVYDWDNRNVWIANNEDCGTNLVAIGTGPDSVPDLVGECGSDSESTTTSAASTASTETEMETETEVVTATVTEDVTTVETVPSDTTTVYFPTTRFVNTTVAFTNKDISTKKPTGGSGDSYDLPSYTDSAPSTTITSTVVTSKVYTVTACPPSVTNCPVGQVTTETITSLTTYCPGSDDAPAHHPTVKVEGAPKPTNGPLTSYVTATNMHTITSCPGNEACHTSVITEIVHNTQAATIEEPAIFTIPEAIHCGAGNFGCKEATTKGYRTITITPVVEAPKPTPVPGYCSTCGPLGEGHGHHNNDDTATGGHTGGSNKPTQVHPTQGHPTQDSPKPTADSPGSPGSPEKPNPLEGLQTYRPTNVFPVIPSSNTVATVVKPTGTPQAGGPSGPGATPTPVVISGASVWNAPILAAVVIGAIVAAL